MSTLLATTTTINTRTALRDGRTAFFATGFPFAFVGLFAFMRTLSSDGGAMPDPMVLGLPAVAVMAQASLVIYGTAQPLVTWRANGTLRLLATTPLPRGVFLAGMAPVRLVVGVLQALLTVALAAAFGVLAPGGLAWFAVSTLVALVFWCGVGLLLAALFDSAEGLGAVGGGLMPMALMASGVMIPLAILPDALQRAAAWNPIARIGDLLRADLTGAAMDGTRFESYAVILVAAVTLFAVAIPLFGWERRRERRAARGRAR